METTATNRGIPAAHSATAGGVLDLEEQCSRLRAPGGRRPAVFDARLHIEGATDADVVLEAAAASDTPESVDAASDER
jgi:hypothetical protein